MAENKEPSEASSFNPDTSKVIDLKRFLRDHGQHVTGTKGVLVARAKGVFELGLTSSNEIRENETESARVRNLERFVTPLGEDIPNPEILKSNWTGDVVAIPEFRHGELYNYLVLSNQRTFDSGCMKAKRQLKAKVFYEDGHVHSVVYHEITTKCSHCYVKARVIPSIPTEKENKKPDYTTWVCLSKVSGRVHAAGCSCSAGTPWNHYDWVYALKSEGREFKRLCNYVHEFSSNIIEQRKRALASDPTQIKKRHLDFLDILLTAKDETGVGLTDVEIRDEVDTFMFAGHDTTASAISWAIHHLAKYPAMQQRVRYEVEDLLENKTVLEADDLHNLTYTTCFIKESMRMYPPVPGVMRKLNKPLTIEGVTFPAGMIFDVHFYPMHHNEEVWKDHMEFRPERFFPENIKDKDAYAFLPFSAGQRNCIGQHFALNEVKVLLSRLVERFEVSLDPERVAEPLPELIMRAKDGIYLNFKER